MQRLIILLAAALLLALTLACANPTPTPLPVPTATPTPAPTATPALIFIPGPTGATILDELPVYTLAEYYRGSSPFILLGCPTRVVSLVDGILITENGKTGMLNQLDYYERPRAIVRGPSDSLSATRGGSYNLFVGSGGCYRFAVRYEGVEEFQLSTFNEGFPAPVYYLITAHSLERE